MSEVVRSDKLAEGIPAAGVSWLSKCPDCGTVWDTGSTNLPSLTTPDECDKCGATMTIINGGLVEIDYTCRAAVMCVKFPRYVSPDGTPACKDHAEPWPNASQEESYPFDVFDGHGTYPAGSEWRSPQSKVEVPHDA